MAKELPEKIKLGTKTDGKREEPKDLDPEKISKYNAYYAERERRKDLHAKDVAQEAVDCVEELAIENRSPTEAFTKFGYSLRLVVKPALAERDRIKKELKEKPSKDVESDFLDVAKVKEKYEIPEFVEENA